MTAPTGPVSATVPSAADPVTFGRVPHPPCEWRTLDERRKPSGWSRLGPRRIVGTCVHRMEGTLRGTEQHFLSDDPHGRDALTDYGIGGILDGPLDGRIWGWLAPDDERSPWANGPADDLDGDGPDFVRAYGVAAVNRDLRSIELSGFAHSPVTPAQLESLAWLIAYWHDQARVPWQLFPIHPASGVVTQLQHWEFSGKECPFGPVRNRTDDYQARAREIMRRYQTGSTTVTPPDDTSFSASVAWLFGETTRTLADGAPERWPNGNVRTYRFDPSGPVSQRWLARANAEGTFPRVLDWRATAHGDVIRFQNGWVLVRSPAARDWTWLTDASAWPSSATTTE